GVEGESVDPEIVRSRKRDVAALLATLFLSRGTPLMQQGDEMFRTQKGNNNAYAQDNEIAWLDWQNADDTLIDLTARLIAFRKAHPAIHHDHWLTGREHH